MIRCAKIAPSILSADFGALADAVRVVEDAGADEIHVDVMDGHFVPNLSMGPVAVRALDRVTALPLDVHLMITDPDRYVKPFVDAGADHITFHVETDTDHQALLDWLCERNIGRGIALSPDTPVERVLDYLGVVDRVLVMTVYPGFGGQSFLGDNLDKVRRIRSAEQAIRAAGRPEFSIDIQVDGGVDEETIVACHEAGADNFVAGSTVFGSPDPAAAVRALKRAIGSH